MRVVIGIILLFVAIALFVAKRRGHLDNDTQKLFVDIATIVVALGGVIVIVVPFDTPNEPNAIPAPSTEIVIGVTQTPIPATQTPALATQAPIAPTNTPIPATQTLAPPTNTPNTPIPATQTPAPDGPIPTVTRPPLPTVPIPAEVQVVPLRRQSFRRIEHGGQRQ